MVYKLLVVVLESCHKGNNAPLFRSADHEERMRPDQQLGSVLWVFFDALTWLVGWQKGHVIEKLLLVMVLASGSWCKGISVPFLQESSGGWRKDEASRWFSFLRSVLWVFFGALTWLVGWQEGHPACKYPCHLRPKVLFQNKWRKKLSRKWLS